MLAQKKIQVDHTLYIVHREIAQINEHAKMQLRESFEHYRKQGIIIGKWNDRVWKIDDSVRITSLSFSFDEKEYNQHQRGLSCGVLAEELRLYIMLSMGKYVAVKLRENLKTIKNIMQLTDYFTVPEHLDIADEKQINWGIVPPSAMEFFRFFEIPNKDRILEILEDRIESAMQSNGQRDLAEFESYFLFGRLIEKFWLESAPDEKEHFYPLYLYFRFTIIYPSRVTEFCVMPQDPISQKGDGYYITVRKSNCKGHNKAIGYTLESDYDLYTFAITEEMARLFLDYECVVKKYSREEGYFFSADMQTARPGRYKLELLSRLLDEIYDLFSERYAIQCYSKDQYLQRCCKPYLTDSDRLGPHEIIKMNLGDTRHLATIGLVVNGCNPILITEFTGHASIIQADWYYSNIEKYINCSVYAASAISKQIGTVFNFDRYHNQKGLICQGKASAVDRGMCFSRNPCDCFDHIVDEKIDCMRCSYFKPDHPIHLKEVEEDIKIRQKGMKKQIEELAKLLKMKDRSGRNEEISIAIKRIRAEAEGSKKLIMQKIMAEQERGNGDIGQETKVQ